MATYEDVRFHVKKMRLSQVDVRYPQMVESVEGDSELTTPQMKLTLTSRWEAELNGSCCMRDPVSDLLQYPSSAQAALR
jgi:hypothetical protein